jgi:hypothetical protein
LTNKPRPTAPKTFVLQASELASPGLCGGPHLLQCQQQLQHAPRRVNRQQHTALQDTKDSTKDKTCAE